MRMQIEEVVKENTQIGEFIKINRKNKNILAKDIADLLDVTPAAISGWESGEKLPSLEKAAMLSFLFGTTLDDFYSCIYPSDTLKSRTLYEYVLKKRGNSKQAFNKFDLEHQNEIIKEFLFTLRQFKRYLKDFLKGKEIEEKEFDRISSLLGASFVNINEIISSYYIIYKVDDNFDVKDFFASKSKNQFIESLDDSHFVISLPNKKKEVLFLKKLAETDETRYEEEIYDSKGNRALVKNHDFSGRFSSKMLRNFKIICEIREINNNILYENLEFEYINNFTEYLLKRENIKFLKEIMPEISQEYKDSFLSAYLKDCELERKKYDVEILYILLMSGATINGNLDKTLELLRKVCEALYKHKSYIN